MVLHTALIYLCLPMAISAATRGSSVMCDRFAPPSSSLPPHTTNETVFLVCFTAPIYFVVTHGYICREIFLATYVTPALPLLLPPPPPRTPSQLAVVTH